MEQQPIYCDNCKIHIGTIETNAMVLGSIYKLCNDCAKTSEHKSTNILV